MDKRNIKRIAFLQEYVNRPWTLKEYMPEISAKGYRAIGISVDMGQENFFSELARKAEKFDLEVMAFTGFMKYDEAYLKEHPDQLLVCNTDLTAKDQDRLGIMWGCPFNPDFQKRYFNFLETLGKIPNLTEVWVNDEAYIGFSANQLACYCSFCQAEWKKEFNFPMPVPPFKDIKEKSNIIHWRFRRWNDVHGRMKHSLNRHHPIRTVFLTSPGCTLDSNPWVSGVDLSSMIEKIDGVMTDPYYTYHLAWGAGPYLPREVYLSENCRFLRGLAGSEKSAEICTQGFSHPLFTRPLDRNDGWWAGVIPPALGIDAVTSYTYPLQKVSLMQETYEKSFRLDEFFAQTRPLDFAAVIDSLETQCFHIDIDHGEKSWHHSYLIPAGEVFRDHGLPYVYLPSRKLTTENLNRWPVITLPGVSCLDLKARNNLREYVRQGGLLISFGETATRNEIGEPADVSFLSEVLGIKSLVPQDNSRELTPCGDGWGFSKLNWPDEITRNYKDGKINPLLVLHKTVNVEANPQSEIPAVFSGSPYPAVVINSFGKGKTVFVCGLPSRNYTNPVYKCPVLNFAGQALANIITILTENKMPIRVVNYPPDVPIKKVRPLDSRWVPTAEFFPCVGENLYLATVASYFKEPMEFQIQVTLPAGKRCLEIRELTGNQEIQGNKISKTVIGIPVRFSFDDGLKVFAFFFEQE